MIGQTIAHYKITAKLGEGSVGEVCPSVDEICERVYSRLPGHSEERKLENKAMMKADKSQ